MFEEQIALWTMSRPITSEYNIAMQDFTAISYITSEQHMGLTEARIKEDAAHLKVIGVKLKECSPFHQTLL